MCCSPARRKPLRCRRGAAPCLFVRRRPWRKSATAKDRGYYFDFVEFQKNAEQSMTPSTPSIGHVYALASKLEDMFAEGLEARHARHAKLAQMTRDWAAGHGFNLCSPRKDLNRSP